MARRVLEDAGCSVTEAQNGDVALRIFSEDPQRFDLLLTDLVMPIMSGQELAQEVEAIEPDMPILFMSGYTEDLGFRTEGHLDRAFLQKPFRPAELVDQVIRVLGIGGVVEEPTL